MTDLEYFFGALKRTRDHYEPGTPFYVLLDQLLTEIEASKARNAPPNVGS